MKKETQDTNEPVMFLNGKPATKQERKRILNAGTGKKAAHTRENAPIAQSSRPFNLMR